MSQTNQMPIRLIFALLFLLSNGLFAAAEETVLQKILRLPMVPAVGDSPFERLEVYDGVWTLQDDGSLSVQPAHGPRLVLADPEYRDKHEGAVSVELYFPDRSPGLAGLITKVSDCGIGADAFNGYEISLQPERNLLMLGAHRQNFRHLRDVPYEVPVEQWIKLETRFSETKFEVWIDGKKITEFAEPDPGPNDPLRRGTIGIRPWVKSVMYRNLHVDGKPVSFDLKKHDSTDVAQNFPETLAVENLPPIAVLLRYPLSSPYSVGLDLWQPQPKKSGCEIRIIEPADPAVPPRTIFADPDGCIYDMNLSFDAKTLYFSYRKMSEKHWNLWKIGIDGNGLTRLTDAPFYDVGPCELPDGDIVFVSTRRFGHTVCQPGPASNLFRMKPDGSGITCVSMNTLSDFSPQMLPDGRVLFTRWEYIDRDLTYRQSLWTQNPDGTGYQLFFGNTIRDVGTFWQARPLPGRTAQVVATFAPHHGFPHGAIGLIDRSVGVEAEKNIGFTYITRDFPVIADHAREWSYRDPFPLSDETFLCSYGGTRPTVFDSGEPKFRIFLLNTSGEKRLLYEDAEMSCYFPIPLIAQRKPMQVAPRADEHESGVKSSGDQGPVLLVDVYRGIESVIPRGSVKSIRLMEQIRKTEDLTHRAFDQSPVMSYGTYYAKRNWGTVPVEQDGSAYFKVPALREIYLQILDGQGRELHRMTSALQLMPGETLGCVGCHESRDTAPPMMHGAGETQKLPMAAARSASVPRLPAWTQTLPRTNPHLDPGIIDYPSVVQPVLDKYCIACHTGEQADGGYDLTGDKTRFFSMSYDNLLGKSRSYRQHDMETGDLTPHAAAQGKPLVHFYWLLWTPTAVHRPFQSGSFASRLPDYLESDHCGMVIPLEDRQKIYLWIDANVPYYGTYANSRPNAPGLRDRWSDPQSGQYADWFRHDFLGVYKAKCAECHGQIDTTIDWEGRYAWINLSRPEQSAALTAHLPKSLLGRESPKFTFESKENPDYQTMLRAIRKGREIMLQTPEADMDGFPGARPEP